MLKTFNTFFHVATFLLKINGRLIKMRKAKKNNDQKFIDDTIFNTGIEFGERCMSLAGSKVEVVGLENVPKDTTVVYIANHQSESDIPIILAYTPYQKAFIAKKEILKVPLLSEWMIFMHSIFMDRKNIKSQIEAIQQGVENIKAGYSMVIFPEGTRSRGNPVKEFKAGSFKLAFRSGAPIVPVSIDGSWHIFEEKMRVKSCNVTLVIHPPVETKNADTREKQIEIVKQVQATIESALTGKSFKDGIIPKKENQQ